MKSNYKALGKYIREVDNRDFDMKVDLLLGVSIQKKFMPSIANTIGTDMSTYKIVKRNQFAYGPVTSRNGDKISIALLEDYDEAIVSQSYFPFEVTDTNELLPQYLMMWFRRPEFDRYARFMSHGSAREIFDWDEMCKVSLPIPHINKQKEIVEEYNTIISRIALNSQLIQKLEETAQAIYKQWFVEFEFPDKNGKPYKSSGGEMVLNQELEMEIPNGWEVGCIGDYSTVKSGFAFKSEWWQSEGIPVIKIGSIQNNTIDVLNIEYVAYDKIELAKNYLAYEGDIVIAMTGATVGKIGIVPNIKNKILVNQRVGLFNLGVKPIERAPFLYLSLIQEFVQNELTNIGGDSAQENISNIEIEAVRLIIPSSEIMRLFNKICRPMIKMILDGIEENMLLEKARNLILSKLATIEN